MKHDLCVADSLQTIQIFDTVLLPCYLPRVLMTRGYEPDSGKSGPMVPERQQVPAGLVVRAIPRRRPRLEQVSIRSNPLRSQAKRPQILKLVVNPVHRS
jgi:hypothetical protein